MELGTVPAPDKVSAKPSNKKAGDVDFMATARKRLNVAMDATNTNRVYQADDLRFAAASPDNKYQWPESVIRQREGDPNGPRPCITINKIPQHVNQITNEQRQNRPSIKVIPVENADKEVAEVITGMVRHIEYQSDAEVAYSVAGENQVQHGEGFIRVITDYVDETAFEQDILIEQIRNSFSVYMEPLALLRDATGRYCDWAFIVEDITEDDFKRRWPNAEPVNWEMAGAGDDWKAWFPDNETVRIAEHFYCEYEDATACLWPDGTTSIKSKDEKVVDLRYAGQVPVKERATKVKKWYWCKMSGQQVLEEQEWAGKLLPVIRMVGNEWFIDGKLVTSGIVRNAKDAQRMFNYWRSTETETLALAPKSPFVGPAEAFQGFEDEWQQANTKNFAFLKYNQFTETGAEIKRPERQMPPMPPVGIVNAALGAADDIKSATGQYDPSLGSNPKSQSGVALAREQRKTDIGTYHYIDNQARAVRQLGRVIVDLIPKIYDTRRVARIIGEDGESDSVTIDPKQQTAVAEVQGADGAIEKIYNPSLGKFDVMVTVGPGYTSKRQEAAEFMAQVLQGNKELMAVMGDLYFDMLDVPGADAISKRLQKTLPPALQDREEGEGAVVQTPQGPVPVEQAGQIMAQMGQQIEQLSQAVEQADMAGAQAKMADSETKRMQLDIDAARVKVDQYNAETARLKAEGSTALDMAKIKEIVYNSMLEYVDRTPQEDSHLLSPLAHTPTAPTGAETAE